jgi:hypothetical protein
MTEVSRDVTAQRKYVESWVSFSTGRAPNENDACTVDLISGKLTRADYTILNLLTDLSQTDSFTLRNADN